MFCYRYEYASSEESSRSGSWEARWGERGKARAAALTAEQRSESARIAAEGRDQKLSPRPAGRLD
jgi:hypothetical protein